MGRDAQLATSCAKIWVQVDAKLSWRRSTGFDHLWFFYYPRGFCGVLPVWGGYHRLFFLADDTGIPDRDPTLEEMQAIAREVTEDETLGSGLIGHSQKMTVAARATAEKKTVGLRS